MAKKDIRKKIFLFLRNEISSKKADWGEFRRVKGIIDVKKGLPNVPSLILQVQPLISYFVIIIWPREMRIYLFDRNGSMLGAESYFENTNKIYDFICSKSKKITRYPSKEKEKSIGQLNSEYDSKFQTFWKKLSKALEIPSKIRKNRPMISTGDIKQRDFLNSYQKGNFIYIKHPTSQLKIIYTYYCLFFFIPEGFRKNKEISQDLTIFLLSKVIKTDLNKQVPDLARINKKFVYFRENRVKVILKYLYRISDYYDEVWGTKDFEIFIKIPIPDSLQSVDIAGVFCKIFNLRPRNLLFLVLSRLLGVSQELYCQTSEKLVETALLELTNDVIQWKLSKVIKFLTLDKTDVSKGVMRALKEAIQYKFSTAIKIEMTEEKKLFFLLKNRTDLHIVIDKVIQVYEDGKEEQIQFDEIVIKASTGYNINLGDLKVVMGLPLKLSYHIMYDENKLLKPVFSGTIVL
ncbi:MAG: hypothetical protein ACTSW1_16725 [Candidatus Hodarchaeales archaeon]